MADGANDSNASHSHHKKNGALRFQINHLRSLFFFFFFHRTDASDAGSTRALPARAGHARGARRPLPLPRLPRLGSPHRRLPRRGGGGDGPLRVALLPGGGPVGHVDAGLLDAVPSLRCVITVSAGVNNVDLPESARRGVGVANAAGIYSADVTDHAVGLLVDVLRWVSAGERFVRRGLWRELRGDESPIPLGSRIGGKRVGIIGLGGIGSSISRRMAALGCAVSYHSRRRRDGSPYGYFPTARDLAAHSDVLFVACALNAETRHIVDGTVLDALGSVGVVVNVARGGNVDEAELVRALAEGRLAGAELDVFDDEPDVPEELLAKDNIVLTPHQAVFTAESKSDLRRLIVANLEAFFAGEPLLKPVAVASG